MISWAWGRRSMGKTRSNRSVPQCPAIWGESELVAQVSMTSGSRDEAVRLVALGLAESRRYVDRGVDGQVRETRQNRCVIVHLVLVVGGVPDRERHAEESLTRDVPIDVQSLDPGLVAVLHEVRVPVQFAPAREKFLTTRERLDEPLARGHDLEGPFALLVELDRVRDGSRFADEFAARA